MPNNTSLLFKVELKENSVLFCADCHSQYVCDFLLEQYGTALQAEYVQPGHHGFNSLPTRFYDVVNPSYALFDAPEWLMTGDEYDTKDLAAYFLEKGVTVYDYTTAPNVFGLN